MKELNEKRIPLGYGISMISRLQTAAIKERVKDLGISYAHVPFLAELLSRNEPVSQDVLSKSLCIDPAATARALEQLQKKGFIRRRVNPKNRRQKLITVTDKTNWMKADFWQALHASTNDIFSVLSAEEQDDLSRLFGKVFLHSINND